MKLVINMIMKVTWGLAGVDLEGIEVVLGGGVGHCEGCVCGYECEGEGVR